MRADTVAEAIAAHYGVTKAQLLDKDAAGLLTPRLLARSHFNHVLNISASWQGLDLEDVAHGESQLPPGSCSLMRMQLVCPTPEGMHGSF